MKPSLTFMILTFRLLYVNFCYNLRLRVRLKKKPCIRVNTKNLIKFLVQCFYLIYTRLIVYTIQIIVYSKDHTYYILLICNITLFFKTFYIFLCVM